MTFRNNIGSDGSGLDASNLNASSQLTLAQKNQANKNGPQQLFNSNHLQKNSILAALPAKELDCLSEHLELILMPVGKMLYEPGLKLQYAYFPTTCMVSLFSELSTGETAEAASVGNEGMIGVQLVLSGDSMPSAATVLISGYAYKLDGHQLKYAFAQHTALQQIFLRYIQVLWTQIAQTAVCNRHHTIEQQLCRWLLLAVDRISTNELMVTQEMVSGVLGVRRESITQAASHLQRAGLISCRRGHISVLNRAGLELATCECYHAVKTELMRLLAIP